MLDRGLSLLMQYLNRYYTGTGEKTGGEARAAHGMGAGEWTKCQFGLRFHL